MLHESKDIIISKHMRRFVRGQESRIRRCWGRVKKARIKVDSLTTRIFIGVFASTLSSPGNLSTLLRLTRICSVTDGKEKISGYWKPFAGIRALRLLPGHRGLDCLGLSDTRRLLCQRERLGRAEFAAGFCCWSHRRLPRSWPLAACHPDCRHRQHVLLDFRSKRLVGSWAI
jgi:hypothetical protein